MATKRCSIVLASGASLVALAALAGCGGSDTPATAAAAPLQAAAAPVQAADTTDAATIVAQGTGKVEGVPDMLTISLGIHTQADKAADALTENNLRAQALLDALAAQGVADKDVQTQNVSVGPVYGGENFSQIVGYQVDNSVVVKLHDLDRAGSIIDAVVAPAGDAIRVQGLGFSIDDPTDLLAAARADAVRRAKEQAEQLATAAGVALGKVRTISEVTSDGDLMFNAERLSGAGDAASVAVPIAPGSQEVTLQVTVVYEIDQ